MRPFLSALLVLVAGNIGSLFAETPTDSELSPAEQTLVALMTGYYESLEIYWSAQSEYETSEAYEQAIRDGTVFDPNAAYIPQLLSFEEQHRGEDVGLLALWHVFREAARGGTIDAPTIVGRREAATRLTAYAPSDLLPTATRAAMIGYYEPAVYEAVSELIGSLAIPTANRDMLRYYLAAESLETRDAQNALAKRVKALHDGEKPSRPGELDYLIGWVGLFPADEELQARCNAAMRTLEELAEDEQSPRLRSVKGVDEQWHIVRVTEESSQPLLADKAAAVLFKERHLKVGSDAPDLEVTLIDGALWRLADQVGKVVVVQFSFTGCSPCEQMYPDLAELSKDYSDRVEILTLMSDKDPQSARDGAASGKFTWNVTLDGKPGRVATQWSVSGFPTIYIIGRDGKIAAHDLRDEALRDEVASLLDTDE
jgi:thiol-disulfide isomerase/thioredoxin